MPGFAHSRCRFMAVALGLAALGLAALALADPLPTPAHWMGGRLVPASAVPVDMVSEELVARLTRYQPSPQTRSAADEYFARADVEVTYVLRADRKLTVPIVFPIINEPRTVSFTVNGAALATTVISDCELYSAYEQAWRAAIDRYVSADSVLAGLRAEARRPPSGEPTTSPRTVPSASRHLGDFMRVFSRVQRRLDELQLPDARTLGWGLSHYLLDDWDRDQGVGGLQWSADYARRRKLYAERQLALALAPTVPDPAALWSAPAAAAMPVPGMDRQVFFVSARLGLRSGDNAFRVRYQHPVSFTNVRYELPADRTRPSPSHRQANNFEFILRTARFWRSFGNLGATIYLPPGTVYAACNLPGAAVSLAGAQPTVTCAATGVPATNLIVSFADFKVLSDPSDDREPFAEKPTTAPTAVLRALWDHPLSGGHFFGCVPAVDDQTVAVGGPSQVTLLDRARGQVTGQWPVTGEAKHLLLLPEVVVAGVEVKGKGSYDKPGVGLVCLDRATGAVRWSQTLPGSDYRSYDARPVLAGNAVVACADGGPAFAADLKTGKLLWRQEGEFRGLTLDAEGRTAYLAGVPSEKKKAASPSSSHSAPAALAEVIALNVATGQVQWRCPAGYESFAPAVWGERLLVAGMDRRFAAPFLACLGRASGRLLWKKPLGERGPRYNTVFATRVADGRLLVCSDHGVDAYDLQHPPALAWQAGFKYQLMAAPPMTEQFVWAPGRLGGLQKFDLRTGRMVQELTCTHADSAAALAGDQLFTLEFSGLLTAWSLDAAPAAAPAPAAAAGWPGVPPPDLAKVLAGGVASPLGAAPSAGTRPASRRPLVSVIVGALILSAALVFVVRRRRRSPHGSGA